MWVRKRIDLGARDLVAGFVHCCYSKTAFHSTARIENCFSGEAPIVLFSVRSGFDLLLDSVAWPRGSEIIFSGLTIPDLPRIARAHGFVPRGVDLDWRSLAPSISDLESNITSKTRAIVIAHLMGGQCPLEPIGDFANRHGLLLVEDCAQVYTGNDNRGSSLADVSMFSFGSIKTNTALGGSLFFVRDPVLKSEMARRYREWPVQSTFSYAKRLAKYATIKAISNRRMVALIRTGLSAMGRDHDNLFGAMARGFSGPQFFRKIRKRPSRALLSVLARRLERFDENRIERRTNRGELLVKAMKPENQALLPLGYQSCNPTHWVFAILVANPDQVAEHLWSLGFDATRNSSLAVVESKSAAGTGLPICEKILEHIVFLPLDLPMPESEIERMGNGVASVALPIQMLHLGAEKGYDFFSKNELCMPKKQFFF